MEDLSKIVVMCGGPFAYRSISALAFEKHLSGIVIGTSNETIAQLLQKECEQSGIPFLHISDHRDTDQLDHWLDNVQPTAVFSVCFPFLVPAHLLNDQNRKFINFHTGPLPKYRGPMPIFEVLRRNEKETAMTVHWMTESYDEGAVIYAEPVAISNDDTFTSLALKLSERCGLMVLNMAEMLQFSRSIPSQPQRQEVAQFHPFPKREELRINWNSMTAEDIISLINACNGWNNGATALFNREEIHLIAAEPTPSLRKEQYTPGTIVTLHDDGSGEIACINGKTLKILQFGTEDGLYSGDFLRQMGINTGQKLD